MLPTKVTFSFVSLFNNNNNKHLCLSSSALFINLLMLSSLLFGCSYYKGTAITNTVTIRGLFTSILYQTTGTSTTALLTVHAFTTTPTKIMTEPSQRRPQPTRKIPDRFHRNISNWNTKKNIKTRIHALSSNTDTSDDAVSSSLFWPSTIPSKQKQQLQQKQQPNTISNKKEENEEKNNDGSDEESYGNAYDYDSGGSGSGLAAIDYYDQVFDSIVKIYATHNREPDTSMPWQKQHPYVSTSSGFVIEGKRILTNAHSVEYAGQILIRKRGSHDSKKYPASISILANECDLAILTIDDEDFWYHNTNDDDDDDDYKYEYNVDNKDYEVDEAANDNRDISDTKNSQDEEEEEEHTSNEYTTNNENNGNDENNEEGDADDINYHNDKDDEKMEESMIANTNSMIKPLEFGVLPELQDEVEVLGYPTGGDSLSVTKGVVSRIEATEYAQCSGSYLLAIQIDAAINGGNSGGPVVDAVTGRVVGVAFQSLDDAENIGYVIPVTVVQHFLEDIRRNHGYYWSGITSVGITYKRLENPTLRKYLQLPTSSSNLKTKTKTMKKLNRNNTDKNINIKDNATSGGVMIRSCGPTSPARHVLKPDDVILKIDGISVSSDGNIPFRRKGKERVTFASYIQTKFHDETVSMDLWRNGQSLLNVEVPLSIGSNKVVPSHWNNAPPPYLIIGGCVFTALSVPYLQELDAWGNFVSESISYLLNKIHEPFRGCGQDGNGDDNNDDGNIDDDDGDQVVIMINVLAHPNNLGYDNLGDLHLLKCNNEQVRSLKHLQKLISKARQQEQECEFIKLEFASTSGSGGTGTLVVLETKSIEETTNEVCEEHSIQNSYYFPP